MKTYRTIFLLTIWAGLLLLACTKQEVVQSDTDKICLSASISSMETRANEVIESGDYYLTYNSSGTKKVCKVSFVESKGYPLVYEEDVYRFLQWSDVDHGQSSDRFTLDNLENTDDATTVSLEEDRYTAASLDEKPYLDIVWGWKGIGDGGGEVSIVLSHRMAKLSLEISVDADINLENKQVKITLTDVINKPKSFNRTSGAVSVDGEQRSDIMLYNAILTRNPDESTYTITSWIFPPQDFDGKNWPKLRIEFDDKIYEGTLNHHMVQGAFIDFIIKLYEGTLNHMVVKEGSLDTPFEMTGFKSGQHLTLRAKLSKTTDEVELIFMPVWVRKWEEIDNIGIGAKQRGVYTKEDYARLVTAYNKDKDENVLNEYGTKDDVSGKWTFVLFRNIGDTGDDHATMPKFKDDGFEINFNSYTVYGFSNKDDLITNNSETSGGRSGD